MSNTKRNKTKVLHIITRLIVGGAQQNTLLSVVGYGYNACDDHKCDNYITDIESIVVNCDDDVSD